MLLVGLYAGGVFFRVIAPSVQRLPGEAYVRHWQAENADYGRAMPVLVLGSLFTTVAAAVLSLGHGMGTVVLTTTAALLLVGIIVVTLTRHEPLNRAANFWEPARLPRDWEALRSQWQHWHVVRTVLAVLAFCFLLVAQALDQLAP